MVVTVVHYAVFLTLTVVVAELLFVGGIAVFALVLRRPRKKRAKWAAIARDVRDVQARQTQSADTPEWPTVEPLEGRRDQETDDPASHPDPSRATSEATAPQPRVPPDDETTPALLVRLYMHAAEPPQKRPSGAIR